MVNPISQDNKIWDLTPTELYIAYLSLTKKKSDIAKAAGISVGTVGTHLTSIYTKLGLAEHDDDEKRSKLNTNYGEVLREIVREIDEKHAIPDDKISALQQKKAEILKQKKTEKTASTQPWMGETPPDARVRPAGPQEPGGVVIPRAAWFIAGFVILLVFAILINIRDRGVPNQPAANPPQPHPTFTHVAPVIQPPTNTLVPVPTFTLTLTDTPTPTNTPVPTNTPTQTLTPTEPSAFYDDFTNGLNPAWTVEYGSPSFVDGQLVVSESTLLSVGDPAWTNYKVEFDVKMGNYTCQDEDSSTLGVRAKDAHNMLLLRFHPCEMEWSSVINGNRKVIPNTFLGNQGFVDKFVHLIIEVGGNKISLYEESNLLKSFIDNDHPSGKVYLRVRTLTAVDNFKITLLNQ